MERPAPNRSLLASAGLASCIPVPRLERRPGHSASPTLWLSGAVPGIARGPLSPCPGPSFPTLAVGVALTGSPCAHLPGAASRTAPRQLGTSHLLLGED